MKNNEKLTAFFNAPSVSLNTFLIDHYREIGMTNDEFLFVIHLMSQMTRLDGDVDLNKLATNMGWSQDKISSMIEQLREKDFLTDHAKRDRQGKVATQLDFSPLYMKVMAFNPADLVSDATSARVSTQGESTLEQLPNQESNTLTRADIYNMVEQEFGRPLSPIEINTIKNWFDIDHFRPDFIQVALQEAVLNSALNLRYIETILVSWQKKNYHSLQDVYGEKQKHQQFNQRETSELPDISWDVDIQNTDWSQFN